MLFREECSDTFTYTNEAELPEMNTAGGYTSRWTTLTHPHDPLECLHYTLRVHQPNPAPCVVRCMLAGVYLFREEPTLARLQRYKRVMFTCRIEAANRFVVHR